MTGIDSGPPPSGPEENDKDNIIRELREAIKARDEFVAIAAHELRNPMTPILLQVQLLSRLVKSPDRFRPDVLLPRLEILEEAVKEFVQRSTVLLETSRIASGNIRIELDDVDASDLVRRVVRRAALFAQARQCSIQATVQHDVRGTWDPTALEQIAENLLSNALKFGAGKPVSVDLQADGSAARLSVRDNGIGISEDDQKRIFGRFERAITQREQGGFGVGLWLTQRLVTAMGGNIAIASTYGQGAQFTVTLPLHGIPQADETRND